MGTGFGLNDDDSHVLSTQIIGVRHLRPSDIGGLMEANKSIEEIRAEIMERIEIIDVVSEVKRKIIAAVVFIGIGCASATTIFVPSSGNEMIQQAIDRSRKCL